MRKTLILLSQMNKKMKINYTLYFILLVLISTFSACQQIKKSYEETINPKSQENSDSNDNQGTMSSTTTIVTTEISSDPQKKNYTSIYASPEKLDQIQAELMNMPNLKGKKVNVYQDLYFYDFQGARITIKIQDPNIPENIDSYLYANEKWNDPTPVKISGNIKMIDFLFPLDKLKFSVAHSIQKTMEEEAKNIEGGVPSDHIYFTHMQVAGISNTNWYSSIAGSRKDLYLYFDVNGNETSRR